MVTLYTSKKLKRAAYFTATSDRKTSHLDPNLVEIERKRMSNDERKRREY